GGRGGGVLGTGGRCREGGAEDRGQTFHGTLRVMPQYRCYCSPPEGATAARTRSGRAAARHGGRRCEDSTTPTTGCPTPRPRESARGSRTACSGVAAGPA